MISRRKLLPCMAALSLAASVLEPTRAETPRFGTLRGSIVDAATRAPTTCTVAITDATGKLVLEKDSFHGGFRCDGEFVKQLPPGSTRIKITRGLETRPVERTLDIQADAESELSVALERIVDLRQRGWFAGDSHAHMIHGERMIPVTFDDVALAARAQDLQYLSLAQDWSMDNVTPEKLQSELTPRSTSRCVLTWNLEAPKNYYRGDAGRCLGHCWNLSVGGRTPGGRNVIELLLAASAHDYQSEKPTYANFESHHLIHAQGGAVFYTHPARWWTGTWGGKGGYPVRENMRISNLAVELPLDTLLGPTFDGLDVLTGAGELEANAKAFELWCLLLNHGYRVAATGSSDATFDRSGGGLPATARTYTYLSGGFSLPAVARATAAGRTFVTTGPLLLVSVDDQPPGAAFTGHSQRHTMKVECWASATDAKGLTRLELLRNGVLVQTNLISAPTPSVSTNIAIRESESAWYSLRLYGGDPRAQRAMSGAFFFDPEPFTPPPPVPARAEVEILDAKTGALLSGSVTQITCNGPLPEEGSSAMIDAGRKVMVVPATMRLRAQAEGYEAQTLSPFFDNPALLKFITRLTAEDLVEWNTFEQVRRLLGEVKLTFRLRPRG